MEHTQDAYGYGDSLVDELADVIADQFGIADARELAATVYRPSG